MSMLEKSLPRTFHLIAPIPKDRNPWTPDQNDHPNLEFEYRAELAGLVPDHLRPGTVSILFTSRRGDEFRSLQLTGDFETEEQLAAASEIGRLYTNPTKSDSPELFDEACKVGLIEETNHPLLM